MTYNEEYAAQGLRPMCREPLRYGRMNMKECKELKEPFKANIRNPKYALSDLNVTVEAKEPTLFLEVCANVVKVLKEHGWNPEVLIGDLPTVQESHGESAEVEKDVPMRQVRNKNY